MDTQNVEADGPSSIPAVFSDQLESYQSGHPLSAEDIAWVDSCLVYDPPVVSEGDWSSLTDVLFEILTLCPESEQSSGPVTDYVDRGGDTDMILAGEVVASTPSSGMDGNVDDDVDGSAPMNEETVRDNDDFMEKTRHLASHEFEPELLETSLRNAFLPSYNEDDAAVSVSVEAEPDAGLLLYITEPSTDDIFKVWDLNVPVEEGELVKQLNIALSGGSVEAMPPKRSYSDPSKDLNDESLDNIIASMSDLSLNSKSG